jgi:hypothetical protein
MALQILLPLKIQIAAFTIDNEDESSKQPKAGEFILSTIQ